jgi:hypothetical protein
MSRLLLEKPFPGATTCVLVGDALALDRSRLQPFRHLLWLTDRDNVQRARPVLPRHAIETAIVDEPPRSAVEQFLRRDPRHLPSIFVSDIILTQHSDAYRRALAELETTLESHHHCRVARQKDGFLWQKYVFENISDYATRRIPSTWADALHGRPAIVCADAAGLPRALASQAARTIVFAVDAALPALARQGVAADFALALDPSRPPEPPLAEAAPARVILSPQSHPAWQTAFPDAERYYLSNHHPTIEWLATQGIAAPPVAVTDNPAATAGALARFLGCSSVQIVRAKKSSTPHRRKAHEHSSSAASSADKSQLLATLPSPAPVPEAVLLAARNRVRLAATFGRTKSAELRRLLENRTPEAVATSFRQLLADQTFARIFGTFSLKLAPHLAPPIEPDPASWRALLDELDQLSALAFR